MAEMSNNDMFHWAIDRYHEGAIEDSMQILERLVAKTYRVGDRLEFRSRANLCEAYMRLGKYNDAVEQATRLLARARQANEKEFEGEAIGSLAMALEKVDLRGHWEELKPLQVEALEIARQYNSDYWLVQHPETLGKCSIRMGEYENAYKWLQMALDAIHPNVPEPSFFRSRVYQSLADLARLCGNLKEASRYAEIALATAEKNPEYSPHLVAMAKLTSAQIERAKGEKLLALQLVEEIAEQASVNNWKVEEQLAQYIRGEIRFELGHLDLSELAIKRALELARELPLKEEEVISLLRLGQILQWTGHRSEAREMFLESKRLSEERNYKDYCEKSENLIIALF
jgi:tetratricopeptide (TPR) repeat protein